jgi:hypothetical protein
MRQFMQIKIKILFGLIIMMFGINSISIAGNIAFIQIADTTSSKTEVFTFTSNGKEMKGKIYLPQSHKTVRDLPGIFLIDFTEQHFKLATDEFEKVLDGLKQLNGFNAVLVSLEEIPDINAEPHNFEEHYNIYKDMVSYVDSMYTKNANRTFIGKGSESGVVLMALFLEEAENPVFSNFIVTDPSPKYSSAIIDLIEKNNFSKNKSNINLHFSFSTSNNRELCTKLINSIKEAQYNWLQFKSVEYSKTNFENTYPMAYADGIKYVFEE